MPAAAGVSRVSSVSFRNKSTGLIFRFTRMTSNASCACRQRMLTADSRSGRAAHRRPQRRQPRNASALPFATWSCTPTSSGSRKPRTIGTTISGFMKRPWRCPSTSCTVQPMFSNSARRSASNGQHETSSLRNNYIVAAGKNRAGDSQPQDRASLVALDERLTRENVAVKVIAFSHSGLLASGRRRWTPTRPTANSRSVRHSAPHRGIHQSETSS